MYNELNLEAKNYLLKELNNIFPKKYTDEKLLERCYKELDLLYEKDLLFIIEYLYKFKKEHKDIKYYFRGMINNLLILYILDISVVNPLEYNLPYELFTDKTITVDVTNNSDLQLVSYLDKQNDKFKVVCGFFIKDEREDINYLLDKHYLLLPCGFIDEYMLLRFNDLNLLQTINDYREYKNTYMTIRIDNKPYNKNKKISLDNIFYNQIEREVSKILKPKNINDYIKTKSIVHGVDVWNNNQDILFKNKKINLNNLIATREDILEYLLNHQIERSTALEITIFISLGKRKKNPDKWAEYVKVMKKYKCEKTYIDIFSKILFIFGRGQAVSECLYVLDKDNYDI